MSQQPKMCRQWKWTEWLRNLVYTHKFIEVSCKKKNKQFSESKYPNTLKKLTNWNEVCKNEFIFYWCDESIQCIRLPRNKCMVLKTTYGLSFACRQYTMMIAKKTAPKWCKCKRGVEKLIEFKSLCVVFSWALYTTVDDADTSFSCCNVSLSQKRWK